MSVPPPAPRLPPFDPKQLTRQDEEFIEWCKWKAGVNGSVGIAVGAFVPWMASQCEQAARERSERTVRRELRVAPARSSVCSLCAVCRSVRKYNAGPLARASVLVGGAAAGFLVGGILTSSQLTARLDTLDNSSYMKRMANRLLVDKFPMAVADTMEQRKNQHATPAAAK